MNKQRVTLYLLLLIACHNGYSQLGDNLQFSTRKIIPINPDNTTNTLNNNNIRPSIIPKTSNAPMLDIDTDKKFDLYDSKLSHRGKDFESKLNETGNKPIAAFRRNQYLGDATVKTNRAVILCRDHEYVDGDRISISVNGKMIAPRISLRGSFSRVSISLKSGFNQIVFTALNMGSSPPNTAEVLIYDDKGNIISQNQWIIATGFEASFVIIKSD